MSKAIALHKWVFPHECVMANAEDPSTCVNAAVAAETITAPWLALQSRFDTWQLTNILQSSDKKKVNDFGQELQRQLLSVLGSRNSVRNYACPSCACADTFSQAYIDACAHHDARWERFGQAPFFSKWHSAAAAGHTVAALFRDGADTFYPCTRCCV